MPNTIATIYMIDGILSIGWMGDSTGGYPATEAGLDALKLDLKNDLLACADDYDAIDALFLPAGEGFAPQKIVLTGEGDAS